MKARQRRTEHFSVDLQHQIENESCMQSVRDGLTKTLKLLAEESESFRTAYQDQIAGLHKIIQDKEAEINRLKGEIANWEQPSNKYATPFHKLSNRISEVSQCRENKENIDVGSGVKLMIENGSPIYEYNKSQKNSNVKLKPLPLGESSQMLSSLPLIPTKNEGNSCSYTQLLPLTSRTNNEENFEYPSLRNCLKTQLCEPVNEYAQTNDCPFSKKQQRRPNSEMMQSLKPKLCRKPDNRLKKGFIFERKRTYSILEADKMKCIDVTLPVKVIGRLNLQVK